MRFDETAFQIFPLFVPLEQYASRHHQLGFDHQGRLRIDDDSLLHLYTHLERSDPATMTIPELKPEIWAHIFGFLYRQPPPAWEKADWKDLHQHDLTVVSRLSSVSHVRRCSLVRLQQIHHELAMPHLYTSVVVQGLPSLLAYDDHRPLIFWPEKTTPKRDRMAMFIKHIRIAAIPPPLNAPWSYAGLLSGTVDWRDVGESDEVRKSR